MITASGALPPMFDAEKYLNSLLPIGMKLGLERMNLLCDELGRPQDSYETIHVVGTNGKSSVARMGAAFLIAHGRRAGCSISPHSVRWSERVLVSGRPADRGVFGSCVERTAAAADLVNQRLDGSEAVTQFEVATAAAFLVLAESGVEVAVIEAGLGGRLDATNVIKSAVTALTSIGLDHTEFLGETQLEIAAEKLAVLRPGTCLVTGRLNPEVAELARNTALDRHCRLIDASQSDPQFDRLKFASPGTFQRENFMVAVLAVEALIGESDDNLVGAVAGSLIVPGRLERVDDEPPVYIDVAHNRPGAAALAASLPDITSGQPVVLVFATLADKDAGAILSEFSGAVDLVVLTELAPEVLATSGRSGARTFPAAGLARAATGAGIVNEVVPNAAEAIFRARIRALELDGIVLAAGSNYLPPSIGFS